MYISFAVIGRNIRQARKAAGLTQEQLAEKLGCTPLHYGRLERGERRTSLDQLALIGTVLHVPFASLLADSVIDSESGPVRPYMESRLPAGCTEYALILLEQYRAQLIEYARLHP